MGTKAVVSAPRFATLSLVPDSEGRNPKHNENNSCGVMQQHSKLLFHKRLVRICWGGGGGGLTHWALDHIKMWSGTITLD